MTSTYERSGVRGQGEALSSVARHLEPTFGLPRDAEVLTGFGAYASVVRISAGHAVAIATDGVGSKTVIASALRRFDTVGFDCVAMNANDLLCVGAIPIAMVDYIGVNTLDDVMVDDMLRGLGDAAAEAGIAIPGGEMAQLPDVIGSDGSSAGDAAAFDLVGTCIGVVHPERLITGRAVRPGDAIIGLGSSGLHSNGYSLARSALLKSGRYRLDEDVPELGRTLGDELLEPTTIYVRGVTALWDQGIETRGLVHVTGDGLANICRLESEYGWMLDDLLEPQPIFGLIAATGVAPDEMYRVFNMGIGFLLVVPEADAENATGILGAAGYRARRVGTVTPEPGGAIPAAGLSFTMGSGEPRYLPL